MFFNPGALKFFRQLYRKVYNTGLRCRCKEKKMKNILDAAGPNESGTETFTTLLEHPKATIELILSNAVENGQWYEQPQDEWVLLIEGDATLQFEDGLLKQLATGEHLFIPAYKRHRVKQTSKNARWLAVHL